MELTLFGIPKHYQESFLSAWKGDYEGFTLSWLQIEILRWATKPSSIGDLRNKLMEKYSMVREMHQSNFYRIVNSLIDSGHLDVKEEGRSKIISTSDNGAKELGRIGRYLFEMQLERIKEELWRDLIEKINKYTGCLLDGDKTVLVMTPEYQSVWSIIRYSKRYCGESKQDIPAEKLLNQLYFLNYGANLEGVSEHSRINESEVDDFPFKTNYADLFIEFTAIGTFPKKNFLDEAIRVLKPGGKLIIFELTEEKSTVAKIMLKEIATLLTISSQEGFEWHIKDELMSREELKSMLEQNKSIKILEFIPDIVNTKVIVEKIE